MSQPKLGSGERFKKLKNKLAKEGAKNPQAEAAAIGIHKFGEKKMHQMSMHGRKK